VDVPGTVFTNYGAAGAVTGRTPGNGAPVVVLASPCFCARRLLSVSARYGMMRSPVGVKRWTEGLYVATVPAAALVVGVTTHL
jgi:hypothetical protein